MNPDLQAGVHNVAKEAPLLKTNASTIALFLKKSKETGLLGDIIKAPSLSPSPPPPLLPSGEPEENGGRQAEGDSLEESVCKLVNGMREEGSSAAVGRPVGQSKKTPLLPPGSAARGGLLLGRQLSAGSQHSGSDPRPKSVSSERSDASTDNDSVSITVQSPSNCYSPSSRERPTSPLPKSKSPLISEGSDGGPGQESSGDLETHPAFDGRRVPLLPPAAQLKRSESVQAPESSAAAVVRESESRGKSGESGLSYLRPRAFSRSVSLDDDVSKEREEEYVFSVAKPTRISAMDCNRESASPADNSSGGFIPSSRTQSVEQDLAYENEVLVHQIAHLKTHRVELVKENAALRSMLRKDGELTADDLSNGVGMNESMPLSDAALVEPVPSICTKPKRVPPNPPLPYVSRHAAKAGMPSDEALQTESEISSVSGSTTTSDNSGRVLVTLEEVDRDSEPKDALQTVTPPSDEQSSSTERCPVASRPIPVPRILIRPGRASKNSPLEGNEKKDGSLAHKPTPVPRSRAVANLPAPVTAPDQGVAAGRDLPKESGSSQEPQRCLLPTKPTPPPRPKSLPKGQYKPTVSKPREELYTAEAKAPLKTEAEKPEQPQAVPPNSDTGVEETEAAQSREAGSHEKISHEDRRPAKPPPPIRPCTAYKKVAIMSDESWIKKVRSESESSDVEQTKPTTPVSAPPAALPARPRPPAPYRSVSVPYTPSPSTSTPLSVPPPFRPGAPPPVRSGVRPPAPPPYRPGAPPPQTGIREPGLRRPAAVEAESPSKRVFGSFRQKKAKSPVGDRDDRGLTRSSSDDSLTSSLKVASKPISPSRLAHVIRSAVKTENLPKKPPRNQLMPLSEGEGEGDESRPVSMIAQSSLVSGGGRVGGR